MTNRRAVLPHNMGMTNTDHELVELEGFALELGRTAGGIAMAHFRKPLTIDNKDSDGFDPVTNADRAIESVLRASIRARYPEHGIIAEEEGTHTGQSKYTWYLDPIDGTRAFMMGSPLWGTLIGLTEHGRPLFGLLGQPVLEELFLGSPAGSWLIKTDSRERLRARNCENLAAAALASTHPDLFDNEQAEAFSTLADACLLHRFGGDCYNYAMLAAGFIDLVVEGQLCSYDIVPLIPILEGAGCVITDWQGHPPMNGGLVVAAATPALHAQALAVLQGSA